MLIFVAYTSAMQSKLITILLFVPFLLLVFAWEQVKIDQKVSIAFPQKPEKNIIEGKVTWVAELDSAAKVMVIVTDFAKMGVDAKGLALLLKNKKTYSDLKNGFLLGADGAVAGKDSIATFKGRPAYYLKMDMKGSKEDFNQTQLMNVFVGSKMYSLFFMEKYGAQHEADKLKFWNSLKIE